VPIFINNNLSNTNKMMVRPKYSKEFGKNKDIREYDEKEPRDRSE